MSKAFDTSSSIPLPVRGGEGSQRWQSFRIVFVMLAIILGVIAARLWWVAHRLPRDIETVVKKLSSAQIVQKPAVANHAGTLVCVAHTTEQGVGVFFIDPRTKNEITLAESTSADYKASWLNLLGWSPDDQVFAYTRDNMLRFCDGSTGSQITGIDLTNRIRSLAWLTPQRCACIDELGQFIMVEHRDGTWMASEPKVLPRDNGVPRTVLPMNTNTVAWQTDNSIWRMEIPFGKIEEVFSSRPNRVANISFSQNGAAFLITEATTNRVPTYFLKRLRTGEEDGTPRLEQWNTGPSILDAQWINHGKGYACRTVRNESSVLILQRDRMTASRTLFTGGQALNLFCDGESTRAYVVAAKTSEPAGVWICEPDDDEPQYAFSPWGKGKMDFRFQPALVGYAPYGNRHSARFVVVPPANFSRTKKYPLVIGTAGYEWTPIAHGVYAQALAHSGAYVALVNYRWNQSRIETVLDHTNHVLAVYNLMAANPNVDTNHVYLFGFSAGTLVMTKLVENFPGQWRGIMLMNPSRLPEPREGMVSRVLLTAARNENQEQRFRDYEEQLCKVGIPCTWFIHEDEQHVVRSQRAFYDRTMLMINTVFER